MISHFEGKSGTFLSLLVLWELGPLPDFIGKLQQKKLEIVSSARVLYSKGYTSSISKPDYFQISSAVWTKTYSLLFKYPHLLRLRFSLLTVVSFWVRSWCKITIRKVAKESWVCTLSPRVSIQLDEHFRSTGTQERAGQKAGMGTPGKRPNRSRDTLPTGGQHRGFCTQVESGHCKRPEKDRVWCLNLAVVWTWGLLGAAQCRERIRAQNPDTPGWHCTLGFAAWLSLPTLSWFLKWMDYRRGFPSPFLF